MVYIIAGADGTGKSTLFERLKKEVPGGIFIKESYTPSMEEKCSRVARLKDLLESGKTVVYDRATVLDDLVYSPITDGEESALTNAEVGDILTSVVVIYLDCDNDIIRGRLASRGDEHIKAEDIPHIKERYEAMFTNYGIWPWRLWSNGSIDKLVASAKQIITKKNFKLAHIVPADVMQMHCMDRFGYCMCLANIVEKSKWYARAFKAIAATDTFVLMDNGAAEGDQLGMGDLINAYNYIKPNEVVLPDTLLDWEDTFIKTRNAIDKLHDYYGEKLPFTLMAVPQGTSIEEWKACARLFVKNPEIKTIGVSKFLEMSTGNEYIRLEAVMELDKMIKAYGRSDMEVHLLGCSERPEVIGLIKSMYPFVRGCDSAYAYICTQAGTAIYSNTERPAGEIDFVGGKYYNKLEENMQAFELATGVYDNGVDDSWLTKEV